MSSGKGDQHEAMRTKDERKSGSQLNDGDDDVKAEDALSITEIEANAVAPAPDPVIPYTVFAKAERRTITWLIGCSMFFSPFTANIYFPCLEQLQHAVGVNSSLI